MIAKLMSLSCATYLIFMVANLGQLEIRGRFKISASCVLALTNCQPEFVICDETGNLSKAEFHLINSILRKNFLQITEGNLKSLHQVPTKPVNMTKPTSAAQTFSQGKDNSDILYVIETPADEGKLA